MKYRRKRSRRNVRCKLCTPHRDGNIAKAKKVQDRRNLQRAAEQ
jgi:hypothetical protein